MRITGSERALEFVLEDFKWYQKRLKIVVAAAANKDGLHSIQSELRSTALRTAGGSGEGCWCGPRCHSCRVSLTRGGLECHHPCLLPREI